MNYRCRSSLQEISNDGYTPSAMRKLAGNGRKFPFRLTFTRSDLNLKSIETGTRMSISGVQEKVQVRFDNGSLQYVENGGAYLLKPIPSTPFLHSEEIPANEHLCMQIAGQVFGITVPPNALVLLSDDEPAYLVKRYDRSSQTSDGKLHQEDFGQILARSTQAKNWKYTGSYEEMDAAIRISCAASVINLERLWQRIVYCYAISNGDAHWKNFSVLEGKLETYDLSPAYDLLSTSIHLNHESPLALDLFKDGHHTESFEARGFWTGSDYLELARRWNLSNDRSVRWIRSFSQRHEQVGTLIQNSFLSSEVKNEFLRRWTDRVRALMVGLEP